METKEDTEKEMGPYMSDDECCICFHPTENTVEPCQHRMCKECIVRWSRRTMRCPMCKACLLSPCPLQTLNTASCNTTIHFDVPSHSKVGITLCETNRGRVRVKAVQPKDLAHRNGLRKGNIITHINDLPVSSHHAAISIINQAQDHCGSLYFTLAANPSVIATKPQQVPLTTQVRDFFTHTFTRCMRSSPTATSP